LDRYPHNDGDYEPGRMDTMWTLSDRAGLIFAALVGVMVIAALMVVAM